MQALLGPPPILAGEDVNSYDALYSRIRGAVDPKDVIEEFWVRDIVDLLWEALRLRRLKAWLMAAAAPEGLAKLLTPLVPNYSQRASLVRDWAGKKGDALQEVSLLLKEAGLDEMAIAAETLLVKIDAFERIDRLIMQAETRRNAVLREIDRRREAVAHRLREAAAIIDDAEFREICAPEPEAPA